MTLEEIIGSYDPTAPVENASTIPSSWYLDSRIAELEKQTLFSHSWQVACRLDQIQHDGEYVTCEVAGERIVVVRGSDGVVRGFFNVCRHHAAAVVTEAEGEAKQLRCPYHGWTYSLEGQLTNAPDLGGVRDFDRASLGLVPVQVAEWKQWLLVRPEHQGPQLSQIPDLNVDEFSWYKRRGYRLDCNWKVFVDNYLDGGYHVPHLHKSLNRRLDYSEYQIELGNRFCLQSSPYSGGNRALYYWIYPNFMINIYPTAMDTNLVIPRGANQTDVIFDFYFTDVSDEARGVNFANIETSERIQHEDVAICTSVQRGLASRAYSAGRLSARREGGEHLFHRLLHADLTTGLHPKND